MAIWSLRGVEMGELQKRRAGVTVDIDSAPCEQHAPPPRQNLRTLPFLSKRDKNWRELWERFPKGKAIHIGGKLG